MAGNFKNLPHPVPIQEFETDVLGEKYRLVQSSDGSKIYLTGDLDINAMTQWDFSQNYPTGPGTAPTLDGEFADKKYVDDQLATKDDHNELGNLNWAAAGHTIDANIVMADNSITGIDTLTFTDTAGTIAGIQNQNLVDKSAAETISGSWIHTNDLKVQGDSQLLAAIDTAGTSGVFLLDDGIDSYFSFSGSHDVKFSKVAGAIAFVIDNATSDVTFHQNITFDAVTNTIAGIQNQNLVDKTADETITGNWITADQGDVKEPTGHVDTADSTISFVNGTRTFTIEPAVTSFDYYLRGEKVTVSSADDVVIADTTGLHYIYYNSGGTLTSSLTPWAFTDNVVFVALVYWRAGGSDHLLFDERHGCAMDHDTHQYLHDTVGVQYESGLGGTFNDNNTFEVGSGELHDEDLEIDISTATSCRILYRDGASEWNFDAASTDYFQEVADIIQYDDGDGTPADVPNASYVAYWIFGTNDADYPIYSVMGQRTDTTIANARANAKPDTLDLDALPSPEMKLLYRVLIKRTGTGETVEDVTDYRSVSSLGTSGYVATDHGGLTGLADDDHPQYGQLADNETVTGDWTFDDNLLVGGIDLSEGAGGTLVAESDNAGGSSYKVVTSLDDGTQIAGFGADTGVEQVVLASWGSDTYSINHLTYVGADLQIGPSNPTFKSMTFAVASPYDITCHYEFNMEDNIVMGDNSVTGVDTITFTDTAGTIAGIQNQNLVDKSAAETIAGGWTHTSDLILSGDSANLTVTDTAVDDYISLVSDGVDSWITWVGSNDFRLAHATTNIFVVDGTTNDVTADTAWDYTTALGLGVTTASANYGFYHQISGGTQLASYIDNDFAWIGTTSNDGLKFYVGDGSSSLTIDATGDVSVAQDLTVGINITNVAGTSQFTGVSTFVAESVHQSGIDLSTSGRIDSNVADAASAASFWFKPSVSLTSGTDRYLMLIENSAGTDVLQLQSDNNMWMRGGVFTGGQSKSVMAVDGNYMYKNHSGVLTNSTYRGLRCQTYGAHNTGSGASCWFIGGAFNCSFSGGTYTGAVTGIMGGDFECYNQRDNINLNLQYGGRFQNFMTSTLATGSTLTNCHGGHCRIQLSGQNYTVTNAHVMFVNNPTGPGAGTTVTNYSGIYVDNQEDIGTNTQAIWINDQTSDATGQNGNIYMEGGDYDDGHLRLNDGHIWYDGSTLRGKASAPTSSTDGQDLLTSLFFAYNQTGGIVLATGSWVDVTWLTEVKKDSDFTHAASSAEVEIERDGWYRITADCGASLNTGTVRQQATWRLALDTGGGYAEITGTRAATYHRTTTSSITDNSTSITWLINASANDKIKLQGTSTHATYVSTLANACRILVEKVT